MLLLLLLLYQRASEHAAHALVSPHLCGCTHSCKAKVHHANQRGTRYYHVVIDTPLRLTALPPPLLLPYLLMYTALPPHYRLRCNPVSP